MYIEYLPPSPKAPAQEHVSREIGGPLVAAGFAKEVQPPTKPPKPPTFGVLHGYRNEGATLQANCETCHRIDYFVGEPKQEVIAEQFIKFLCVHFRGAKVPEHTLAAYAGAWRFQTFAGPGTRGKVSGNTPDNAPHWENVNGVIAPTPEPKNWDWHKKH
jgi:hypothetical protein